MSSVSLGAPSRALMSKVWIGLPMKLDAELVGMTRLRSIRRQRTTPSTSWFGPASAILANPAQLIRRLARRRSARPVVDDPIWPEAVKRCINRRPILFHADSQSVAQFEREVMLERQRGGIAKAVAAGKYKGCAPTARRQAADIVKLAGEGMKREDIAKRLGVGVASVYRVLASARLSSRRLRLTRFRRRCRAIPAKVLPPSGKGFVVGGQG
jgi:Helix-turn-helix domain of resolvase